MPTPFDAEKALAEVFDHLKAAVLASVQPQLDEQARAAVLDQHMKGLSLGALRICTDLRRRLNQLFDQVQEAQVTLCLDGCADDWRRILAPLWAEALRLDPDGLHPVPALPDDLPDLIAAEQARHGLESWTRSQSEWVQTIAMLAGTSNANAGRLPPGDPAVRHAIESLLHRTGDSGVIWLQPPADPAVRHAIESSFRQLNDPSGVVTPTPPTNAAPQEPVLVRDHLAIQLPDHLAIELDKLHAAAGRPQEAIPVPEHLATEVRKLFGGEGGPQEPIPDKGLTFLPGMFIYRGHQQPLRGKPLEVLRAIYDAPTRALTLNELRTRVWNDTSTSEETIRSTVMESRKALRQAMKAALVQGPDDPLPVADRGANRTAWRLDLPSPESPRYPLQR